MKQFGDIINDQIKGQFSSHQIKTLSLKKQKKEKDNLKILMEQFQYAQHIIFEEGSEKQIQEQIYEQLSLLKQLEGLSITQYNDRFIESKAKLFSQAISQLQNLNNFAFFLKEENIDFVQSISWLTKGISSLIKLEVISFEFRNLSNIQLSGLQVLSNQLRCLPKLSSLNIDITVKKQKESFSEEMREIFQNIIQLIQLKSLNIRIYSIYSGNNKPSKDRLFYFDISQLINLTILRIEFSLMNQYLHIDFKEFPNYLARLCNLEQLYIFMIHSPLSSEEISPLYESSTSLKKLEILQFSIDFQSQKNDKMKKDICLGNKLISLQNLKELFISINTKSVIKKLKIENQPMPRLEQLSLCFQYIKIPKQNLFEATSWIKNCTQLRVLNLNLKQREYSESFFQGLKDAFAHLINLVTVAIIISFKKQRQPQLLMEAFANIPKLESLEIECNRFYLIGQNEEFNDQFKKCIHLKSLKISISELKESIKPVTLLIPNLLQISALCLYFHNEENISYEEFSSSFQLLQNVKNLSIIITDFTHSFSEDQNSDLLRCLRLPPRLELLQLYLRYEHQIINENYISFLKMILLQKKLRKCQLFDFHFIDNNSKYQLIRKLPYLVYYSSY